VGQPELEERLASRELRQLGQRITLSSQLIPLSYKEVIQYIQHRIGIASGKPSVKFSRAAYQAIYRYSSGIPRLINIVSDRALITAYVHEQEKITGDIVKAAIKELAGRGDIKRYSFRSRKRAMTKIQMLDGERFESTDIFLTVDELSERLKVHKSWIYAQTRQTGSNAIPRIKVGKYLRFEWIEVEKWIMRQQ
jgi:excisionase family DNA binding protein